MVLVTGNGSSGTGTFNAAHSGPHPSLGCHSMRRSAGTVARTCRVVRVVGGFGRVLVLPVGSEPFHHRLGHGVPLVAAGQASTAHGDEDGFARALPPRVRAVARRQQNRRIGIGGADRLPHTTTGPVDGGDITLKHRCPVDGLVLHGRMPHRNVFGMPEHLDHVVAGAAEQLLEGDLQRMRTRAPQAGADDA